MRCVLHIFIKNARLGHVKTRLARTAGNTAALQIYQELLAKTRQTAQAVVAERWLWYSEEVVAADAWDVAFFRKERQCEGDLGKRMEHAFASSFSEGADAVVIIGSDCPELTPAILSIAYKALQTHDAVIGPAPDGGYYLLGLRRMLPAVFRDIAWSTETVFAHTMAALAQHNHTVFLLPMLADIDTEADWQAYQSRLAAHVNFTDRNG